MAKRRLVFGISNHQDSEKKGHRTWSEHWVFRKDSHNNSLHPGVSKGSKKLLGNARGSLMMDWHHVQVELLLLVVYIQYFFFHRIIIEVDIMLETRQIKLRQVLKTNIIW